jgi:hypothetical protein
LLTSQHCNFKGIGYTVLKMIFEIYVCLAIHWLSVIVQQEMIIIIWLFEFVHLFIWQLFCTVRLFLPCCFFHVYFLMLSSTWAFIWWILVYSSFYNFYRNCFSRWYSYWYFYRAIFIPFNYSSKDWMVLFLFWRIVL